MAASSLHTVTRNLGLACSELQSHAHGCFKSAHGHKESWPCMLRTPVSCSWLLQVCTRSQGILALHAQNSSLMLMAASSLHTVTRNLGLACSELQSHAHGCFKSAH